mgnify:CR=1 FL=1
MRPPLRISGLALALLVVIASTLSPARMARAEEPSAPNLGSPFRDALWLTGSGALLAASLAGMFALKSDALHDRAQRLLQDSPELPDLERDARTASRLAIGFGVGAAVFSAVSLLLLLKGPPLFAADSGTDAHAPLSTLTPLAGPSAAGLCWRGHLP